ncbi:MAG TPA: hypothetical protein IAB40_04700 [Candidatus Onthocola stercoravium]|nr:hypothetical protein [Candidatus Onthocola stercoravium]
MKKKLFFWLLVLCTFMGLGFNIYNLYEGETRDLLKLGLIGSVLLIYFIYKFYQKSTIIHKKKSLKVLSLILAFFMIFGNSFMCVGSTALIFKNIGYFLLSLIMYIGYYYLFLVLISYLFRFLDKNNFSEENKEKKDNKFVAAFKKHPFLFSLCFIVICWLPYIISYYPIILSPDPSFQIRQFFGIRTKYADYAILLDENVVMTNHHPVTHTMLLGGCLKLGTMIGNDNLGLFFYSIIQISVLASVLAFSIYYMQKMGLKTKYLIGVLLIYALVPMFPLYAMSGVKDVLFGAFIFLYFIFLHNLVKTKCEGYKWWNYLLIIILLILICLFRNNGIHVLILSLPFTLIIARKKWKQLLTVMVCVFGFYGVFDKVILPYYKITPGSIREVLSVPFQQTARLAKYHGNEFTEEEIAVIDKILGYDDLAERYDPELADPVKNEFNKYATDKDLKEYFKVWFNGLIKHPGTYIEATMNNVYGFFYPEKTKWYVYYKFDDRITENGFDYHYNSLETSRNILSEYAVAFPYIPGIGLISNIGFNVWIIFTLFAYAIYKKLYKNILILAPALILILVCVVGPANTYFRYALPFIFAMPFIIGVFLEKRENND